MDYYHTNMYRLGMIMFGLWLGWMIYSTPMPTEIVLVAIGDWGDDPKSVGFGSRSKIVDPIHPDNRENVLNAMAAWCLENSCDGIISTGDNFYPQGIDSIHDPQWQTFERCFGRPGLSHLPFYVTVGNHDYEGPGNISAQIAYGQENSRWIFPSRYYIREIPGHKFVLRLIMLDTMPMVPYYHRINSDEYYCQNRSIQLMWLRETLQDTPSNTINVVVGHHPEVTPVAARHGDKPSELRAILEEFRVPVVLSGHIHNLQHVWFANLPTQYMIVGTGSLIWIPPDIGSHHCDGCDAWIGYEFGFLSMRITATRILLQFWSDQRKLLHQVDIGV